MTELSLNETARRHGVSKAGLSQAVHGDRPIKGMSLHRFAIVEDGRIRGFEFPEWYALPSEDEKEDEAQTVFMTMTELCHEHSAFHRGQIEEALRQGWPVDGFPVYEWVLHDGEGNWDGFDVPKSADLDGQGRANMPLVNEASESPKKDGMQEGSADEDALSGGDAASKKGETRKTGSKASRSVLALGGAVALSAFLNS